MTQERLNEWKEQLSLHDSIYTELARELIAEVERLQAFAELACKLYPALSYEWEAMEEGI